MALSEPLNDSTRAKLQAKLHGAVEAERLLSKPNNSLQLIATDHKMKCFAAKCQEQRGDLGNRMGLCESSPLMEITVTLTHKDCAGIINPDRVA